MKVNFKIIEAMRSSFIQNTYIFALLKHKVKIIYIKYDTNQYIRFHSTRDVSKSLRGKICS